MRDHLEETIRNSDKPLYQSIAIQSVYKSNWYKHTSTPRKMSATANGTCMSDSTMLLMSRVWCSILMELCAAAADKERRYWMLKCICRFASIHLDINSVGKSSGNYRFYWFLWCPLPALFSFEHINLSPKKQPLLWTLTIGHFKCWMKLYTT